jgi:hypothetical protein
LKINKENNHLRKHRWPLTRTKCYKNNGNHNEKSDFYMYRWQNREDPMLLKWNAMHGKRACPQASMTQQWGQTGAKTLKI